MGGKKDKGKAKKGKDKDDKGKKGKSGKQKGKKDKNVSRPNTPASDTERPMTAEESGAEGEDQATAATTAEPVVQKIPSPRPELPFEEEFPLWLDRVIDRWNLSRKLRS